MQIKKKKQEERNGKVELYDCDEASTVSENKSTTPSNNRPTVTSTMKLGRHFHNTAMMSQTAQTLQDFLLMLFLLLSLQNTDGLAGAPRFAGGSFSFSFFGQDRDGSWKVKLSILSGWKLGDGPCGKPCDSTHQGQPSNRSRLISADKNALGDWTFTDADVHSLHDNVTSHVHGKIVAVNQVHGWEQELAEVDVLLNISATATRYTFSWIGNGWASAPYAWPGFRPNRPIPYTIVASQTKMNIRNDTGKPNSSPFASFQITYMAVIGEKNIIALPVGDPDGDRVNCTQITKNLRGASGTLPGLTVGIDQDKLLQSCIMSLNPPTDGTYKNGSYVIVSLELWDYLVFPIHYEGIPGEVFPDNQPLSTITVQFMVKLVVRASQIPEFTLPPQGDTYWVYSGATVKITVAAHAVASGASMESLRMTSVPPFPGILGTATVANGKMESSLLYTAADHDIGTYHIEFTAVDSAGNEARRSIEIVVRAFDHVIPSGSGVRTLDLYNYPLLCIPTAHCSFPFYVFGIQTSLDLTIPIAAMNSHSMPLSMADNHVGFYKGQPASGKDIFFPATHSAGAANLFLAVRDGLHPVTVDHKIIRVLVNASSPCVAAPCLRTEDGFICQADDTGRACGCLAGTSGDHCEIDINECASVPCQHGGTCKDHLNYYDCDCVPGYTGAVCEIDNNECSSSPCQNGGTCHDLLNNYTCSCPEGYTGVYCETNIDECKSNPCQHSGTCHDGVDMYTCSCEHGYTGTDCETDVQHHHGLLWFTDSLENAAVIRRCPGDNLTLFWEVQTSMTGDEILDVQWFYSGHSDEMIAMQAHGHFMVLPAFSGRVERVSNAGLVVLDLMAGDTGKYSVEVVGGDPHSALVDRLEHSVTLEMIEPPRLQGDVMHVKQSLQAVVNSTSNTWAVQLTCGLFVSLGSPQARMVWQTPSGQTVESSSYENGQFTLLLYSPVEEGSYTCYAASQPASYGSGDLDCFPVKSSIHVSALQSYVMILQAENEYLKHKLQSCGSGP